MSNSSTSAPIRLAHLSDIHLTLPVLPWQWHDYFTKRSTGWFNLRCLGRGQRFHAANEVLETMVAELRGPNRPDHIVFSGDATALGFPEEMACAAAALGVANDASPPGLAVPGNHDYYIRRAAASGDFERCFAPWQTGERLDGHVYPFAQRVGPLWLIGVNSCTGNVQPRDAGGSVGAAQLDRLHQLLEGLSPGPRILVTHYPVARANGQPERRTHGLRDLAELLGVAENGGVALWLHGHEHQAYCLNDRKVAPFPVICVGSSTELNRWRYNVYTIAGLRLYAECRMFDPQTRRFRAAESFEVPLRPQD